jgi:lipase
VSPVSPAYDVLDVPVAGGLLRVGRWTAPDPQAPVVLAAHGVTANHLAWATLGSLGRCTVVAPDLRGRGRSHPDGPAGPGVHAEDLLAVLDHLGLEAPMLTGHSMGGFVAAAFVERFPGRVAATVLVDGGLPFPAPPPGVGVDEVLAATIGPAAQRLGMVFATPADHLDFWRPHPALREHWTPALEAYLDYDLVDGRSSVSLQAVHEDSEGILDAAATGRAAAALPPGTVFLRAPAGMLGEPGGLYPADLVQQHRDRFPAISCRDVPGTNHYTVVMGETGAGAVADALVALAAVQP